MEDPCGALLCLAIPIVITLAVILVNAGDRPAASRSYQPPSSLPTRPDPQAEARRRYQQLDGLDGNFDGRIDSDRWP